MGNPRGEILGYFRVGRSSNEDITSCVDPVARSTLRWIIPRPLPLPLSLRLRSSIIVSSCNHLRSDNHWIWSWSAGRRFQASGKKSRLTARRRLLYRVARLSGISLIGLLFEAAACRCKIGLWQPFTGLHNHWNDR